MAERLSIDVEWVLDEDASSDEVAAVQQIALEAGLSGPVTATYGRRSIEGEELDWIIQILTRPAVRDFLKEIFQRAVRDRYKGLRKLFPDLFAARQKEQGTVMISDRGSLTTIVISSPDLPEEAFKQLADLLENIEGKYLVWDPDQKSWVDQSMRCE